MSGSITSRPSAVSAFTAAKALLKRQREEPEHPDSLADEDSNYSSASDDDDTAPIGHKEGPVVREKQQLSTWISPGRGDFYLMAGDRVSLRMPHNARAAFLGVYDLEVEVGAVEVYGTTICPSSGRCRIYAPAISAVPGITCKTRDCRLTLHSCKNYLRQLSRLSPLYHKMFATFPRPPKDPRVTWKTDPDPSFNFVGSSDDVEDGAALHLLNCPREWIGTFEAIIAAAEKQRRSAKALVCGAQKSGKSTLCRILINHAISRRRPQQPKQQRRKSSSNNQLPFETAFLLDLDPGQPELTPPGQISLSQTAKPLLGFPLAHSSAFGHASTRTIRSHTLSNTTSQDDTDHFVACVRDLLKHAHAIHAQYPSATLIINTPGWITGQGLDLTTTILSEAKHTATIILGLSSLRVPQDERDAVATALRTAASNTQIFELDAQAPSHASRTPAELRAMQAQSYFHLKHPRADQPRWCLHPLNSAHFAPLTLHYAGADADILALLSYFETPAPAHIAAWIHRSTVALCAVDDPALATEMQHAARRTPAEELPYLPRARVSTETALSPPDPARTRTLGLAYVRAIDSAAHAIELITPVAPLIRTVLDEQHAGAVPRLFLAAGRFETPLWAYAEDGAWERYTRRGRGRGRDNAAAARVGEYDDERLYVKRLRAGERADLVWKAGATARFGRGV